nr:hypothetical protein [Tanacetum cinerariifolium]
RIEQVRPDLIVVDVDLAFVGREGVEQRQRTVVAFINEQDEVVDGRNLFEPLTQSAQTRCTARKVEKMGDSGGPVFQFLWAHGGRMLPVATSVRRKRLFAGWGRVY